MLYMLVNTQDWPWTRPFKSYATERYYLPDDGDIADLGSLYRHRWELHPKDQIAWRGVGLPYAPYEGPRETHEDLWKFCFESKSMGP